MSAVWFVVPVGRRIPGFLELYAHFDGGPIGQYRLLLASSLQNAHEVESGLCGEQSDTRPLLFMTRRAALQAIVDLHHQVGDPLPARYQVSRCNRIRQRDRCYVLQCDAEAHAQQSSCADGGLYLVRDVSAAEGAGDPPIVAVVTPHAIYHQKTDPDVTVNQSFTLVAAVGGGTS